MKQLLYIIGQPGVGKSALMAELVKGQRRRVITKPFAHTTYEDGLVQLGRERANGFSGTDALSLSVQPQVIKALKDHVWSRVVGEGDRLANGKFFTAAQEAGYSLEVILLEASQFVLNHRRKERGSNQDPVWLKGRASKVQNLKTWVTLTLDATLPVTELADQLKGHPVFRVV